MVVQTSWPLSTSNGDAGLFTSWPGALFQPIVPHISPANHCTDSCWHAIQIALHHFKVCLAFDISAEIGAKQGGSGVCSRRTPEAGGLGPNPAVSLLSWRLGASPLVLTRPPQYQSQGKPSFGETPLILAPKNQSE